MSNTSNSDSTQGAGFAIGIAVGVALGAALGNVAIGLAIGVALGVGFGGVLRQRQQKDDSGANNEDQV